MLPRVIVTPRFVTVWKCGRCNNVLSQGPVRPTVANCPACGVHFINGGGMESHQVEDRTASSTESDPTGSADFGGDPTPDNEGPGGAGVVLAVILIGIGVVILIVVVALIAFLVLKSRPSRDDEEPPPARRRRRRDYADDDL